MANFHHLLESSLINIDMLAVHLINFHANEFVLLDFSKHTTRSYVEQHTFKSDRSARQATNDETLSEDELNER